MSVVGSQKSERKAIRTAKITDCDGEASETDTSLDFAYKCNYISREQHNALTEKCRSVGRMLGKIPKNPKPFLISGK